MGDYTKNSGGETMREILFRGKELIHKQWIYGWYFHTPELSLNQHNMLNADDQLDVKSVIPETVGQYTGLTDKNGTKIFEGDVVSGHLDDLFPEDETRYKVIWDDYGWHIRNSTDTDTFEQGWARQYFEVIGNIHDNPELIDKIK